MTKQDPEHYNFAGVREAQGPLKSAPTRAKIIRAKAQAVGGKKDRCIKGKSCSATCIAFNKDCLVEFPVPVQRELKRMSIAIIRKGTVKEDSLQDRAAGAGILQLGKVFKPGEGAPETTGRGKDKVRKPNVQFDTAKRKAGGTEIMKAERQATTLAENLALKARKDLLGQAEFDAQAMKLLQKDAFGRGLRLRRDELEALYDALPKNIQNSLNNSGKPERGKAWGGKDENGNDIFTTSPGKARGLAVLDMWFRQGGTDAYQGRGGKIFAPNELDVEHVRPQSKGGADAPSNWVLARSGAQRKRQSTALGEWIDKLPSTPAQQRAFLSGERKRKRKKQLANKALGALEADKLSDKVISEMGASSLGKAFGKKGWFTGEVQPIKNLTAGFGRAGSGPPKPFAMALGMVAKNEGVNSIQPLVKQFRQTWNNDLVRDRNISPEQAMQQLSQMFRGRLTNEQFNNYFLPSLNQFISENRGLGFGGPISGGEAGTPRVGRAMEEHLRRFGGGT